MRVLALKLLNGLSRPLPHPTCMVPSRDPTVPHVCPPPPHRLFFHRFTTVMMPSWVHPNGSEAVLHKTSSCCVRGLWAMLERVVQGVGRRLGPAEEARLGTLLPPRTDRLMHQLRGATPIEPNECVID
jgi:hypothetical protein